MNNIYLHGIGFILCTLAIIYSGTKLTKYGDSIAELTGLGKAWIGLILMASVTSLPELMTGISSVTFIGEPDLAAGDIFGSCVFNLLILSFADTRIKNSIFSLVKQSHIFSLLISIILLGTSGLAILLGDVTPLLFWISPFTIGIIGIYFIAIYGIFQHEHSIELLHTQTKENKVRDKVALKKVIIQYVLNAFFVIIAASLLPYFGEHIALQTGLGNTFFGTVFLAASTSLPEFVVSFAAIRMGSYDLLMGNLLGSNIFNILILAIDDIFYTKGSLYADINAVHLESVIVIIMMTAVVGLGIFVRPTKKYWKLSYVSIILIILYIGLMTLLFFTK